MATKEELGLALQKAHEAGDIEGATILARAYSTAPNDQPPEKSAPSRFLQGVGGEVLKAGAGVADLLPENKAHEWLSKESKAGLDQANGFAGGAGKLVGASVPYFALPGGGLVKTALMSGALSGATTEGDIADRAKAAALTGVATGGGGIALNMAGAAKNQISKALANNILNADKFNALNAPKSAALQAGKEAGYVIPPSEVNPSWINRRLESIAGKAAIGQEAAVRNQPVTTELARREIGLAADAPISIDSLNKIRKEAGKSYQAIADLPNPPSLAKGYSGSHKITSAKQDLEALKQARNDAQGWYDAAKVSKSPDDLAKAKQFESISNELENKITQTATNAGRVDLIDALFKSRKKIAQTYNVEKALNKVTGEINANDIGRLIDQGRPLTGDLKTIGDFQQAFPKYLREGEKIPTPGVSKSEAIVALLMGAGGAGAMGPMGAALGAAPLVSGPVRSMLLSSPYQKAMVNIVDKKPSSVLKGVNAVTKNKIISELAKKLTQPMIAGAINE